MVLKNQERDRLLSASKRNDNPEDVMTRSLHRPGNIVSITGTITGGKKVELTTDGKFNKFFLKSNWLTVKIIEKTQKLMCLR